MINKDVLNIYRMALIHGTERIRLLRYVKELRMNAGEKVTYKMVEELYQILCPKDGFYPRSSIDSVGWKVDLLIRTSQQLIFDGDGEWQR